MSLFLKISIDKSYLLYLFFGLFIDELLMPDKKSDFILEISGFSFIIEFGEYNEAIFGNVTFLIICDLESNLISFFK